MIPVHYSAYMLFRTYLKIVKLVLLETRLRKVSRKKNHSNKVRHESYGQNKLGCLWPNI